jgi:serine protease Do
MNKKLLMVAVLLLLPLTLLAGFSLPALGISFPASADAAAGTVSTLDAADVLNAVEATLEGIYAEVSPSVVNIQVVQGAEATSPSAPAIPGFPSDPSVPQQGLGSGFVWDTQGHIVTNNHVVNGADKITVTFSDDTTVPAEVVGTDPNSDLAVIKVDVAPERLHPVQMADSTQIRVGQLAVAIGNPFGLEGTMTVGFVSALGRSLPVASSNMLAPSYTIPDIIQTDAPINPGNSGGVLVNDEAQLIGVPTAIESPVRANAGIGFAVPSAIVQKIVPELIEVGAVQYPWLGISGTSLNSELAEAMSLDADQRGVLVVDITSESPAEKAELRASDRQVELDGGQARVGGDVIVAINGQQVHDFDDLVAFLVRSTSVGDTVELAVLRDGHEETIEVTLAARPGETEPETVADTGTSAGAWLGIQGLSLTPEIAESIDLPTDQQGVLVVELIRNGPADQAGLRGGDQVLDIDGQQVQVGGDVIVAMNGEPVTHFTDLQALLQGAQPGQQATFTLLRDTQEVTVEVTLGERPAITP